MRCLLTSAPAAPAGRPARGGSRPLQMRCCRRRAAGQRCPCRGTAPQAACTTAAQQGGEQQGGPQGWGLAGCGWVQSAGWLAGLEGCRATGCPATRPAANPVAQALPPLVMAQRSTPPRPQQAQRSTAHAPHRHHVVLPVVLLPGDGLHAASIPQALLQQGGRAGAGHQAGRRPGRAGTGTGGRQAGRHVHVWRHPHTQALSHPATHPARPPACSLSSSRPSSSAASTSPLPSQATHLQLEQHQSVEVGLC